MVEICYDENKVPTITHEVDIFIFFEKKTVGIIDNDLNHKNIFTTEFIQEIDVECNPFQFMSGGLGCKIILSRNKTIIEYTIKLSWDQSKLLFKTNMISVFNSVGNWIYGFWLPISKDFTTLYLVEQIRNELLGREKL